MANLFTLQDVYNTCYGIIAQSEDSTAYPTTLLKTFINKAQSDICYGNVHNLQTNERLEKQGLNFLESTTFYTTKNYTTISALAVVGGTTLTSTNGFATSGTLWINGAILTYTGNDGTTITGIPASGTGSIPFAFTSGTQIFQLETLPSDFGQLSRIFLNITSSRDRIVLKGIDDRDLSSTRDSYITSLSRGYLSRNEGYYSIIQGTYILFLVPQTSGQAMSFEYQKAPTTLSATTDVLTIPDDYSLNTIPYMAVSEMLANRGELDEAMKLSNFGFNNIKSMYSFYNSQRQELEYNQIVLGSSSPTNNYGSNGLNF